MILALLGATESEFRIERNSHGVANLSTGLCADGRRMVRRNICQMASASGLLFIGEEHRI
jgi:hypothetical protein